MVYSSDQQGISDFVLRNKNKLFSLFFYFLKMMPGTERVKLMLIKSAPSCWFVCVRPRCRQGGRGEYPEIDQSINRSIGQSVNRSTSQSVNRSTSQSVNWSIGQSVNQSTIKYIYKIFNKP